ncbi:MAG: hypothetical protein QOJ13_1061 [Gaiellales bacterium]|nr:hypothetical protein [Gaiellales bacterium]
MKRPISGLIILVVVVAGIVPIANAARSGAAQVSPSGTTHGVIGGDFDTQLPAGSVNGADWGVTATLPHAAAARLTDNVVFVSVDRWKDGGDQTKPTTTDTNPKCTGTVQNPTAPKGIVCIYVLGGDNAANVSGYSVVPGAGGSKYGFKLKWDSVENGDSFIDAVWAYQYP